MTITLTSREFNQNTAKTKRAAKDGPVIITDRGEPRFVLMSYDEYEKKKPFRSIADALSHPESAHFDFEVERTSWKPRPVDLD